MFTMPGFGNYFTPPPPPPPDITFSWLGAAADTVDRTSYSFSVSTGSAGPLIVCAAVVRGIATGTSITSITLNGGGAAAFYQNAGNVNNFSAAAAGIAYFNSAGGTQTVTVTPYNANGAADVCAIGLFSIANLKGGIYTAASTGGGGTSIGTSTSTGGTLGIVFTALACVSPSDMNNPGGAFNTYYLGNGLLAACTPVIGPQGVSITNSGSVSQGRAIAAISVY